MTPNVLVLSRIGELFGICHDKVRMVRDQFDVLKIRYETQEAAVYHVISDGQAEDSSVVVDEGCRVDSKGRHADIQHVVVLGWQVKGRW